MHFSTRRKAFSILWEQKTEWAEKTRGWQNNLWPPGASRCCCLFVVDSRGGTRWATVGLWCSQRRMWNNVCVCKPLNLPVAVGLYPPSRALVTHECGRASFFLFFSFFLIDMIKCTSGWVTDYMPWYSHPVIRLTLKGTKFQSGQLSPLTHPPSRSRTVHPQVNSNFVLFCFVFLRFAWNLRLVQTLKKMLLFIWQIKCNS